MSIRAKFAAFIKSGKLVFKDQIGFITHLASFREGSEVWVTVGQKQKDRTLNQNAWYWAVVLPILSEWAGNDVNDMHEIVKQEFIAPKFLDWMGKQYKITPSTAKMNTKEFTDYIERIRAFVATSGVIIPDPDSVDYDWIDR